MMPWGLAPPGSKDRGQEHCEEYLFLVASGIVAGGALMDVVLVFRESGPEVLQQLLGHPGPRGPPDRLALPGAARPCQAPIPALREAAPIPRLPR